MSKSASLWMQIAVFVSVCATSVWAQTPTGTIAGTVKDQTGAVVPAATITITNKANNLSRTITANGDGIYSAPALPAGDYQVRVEMKGFRTDLFDTVVTAGTSTTLDAALSIGEAQETVNVEATAAQVNTESHTIAGVIARGTIQELPLNGRNFLQLASLEPGVTIGAGAAAQFNSQLTVTTLGMAGRTLFTIDGGNVNDEMEPGAGAVSINFSQEIVQEFQMSTVNFDNATGITSVGSINIVTRGGGNDFHASAYYYYRDHNLAAYPGLSRSPINPDPFFQRKNPGFLVSGPIKKDKAFFFFNYEHMAQTQVYAEQQDLPSLQPLNGNFPSPYHSNLITTRIDYQLSPKNTLFARYSHDGNYAVGPYGGTQPIPSSWSTNGNWSDQSIIGLTTTFTANLVNDVRAVYHYWENNDGINTSAYCPAGCVGGGLPSITSIVGSSTFDGGTTDNGPQHRQERSYQVNDTLTWQKGQHRLRVGMIEEVTDTINKGWDACTLGCLSLYSPETVESTASAAALATYFPNLPTSINSTQSLLNLPVSLPTAAIYAGVPVGNPTFPGYYQQADSRNNWRSHPWVADTWKIRPNLTLNYGLGYDLESGLWYTDLPYPEFLAPIIGQNNVGKTAKPDYLDFSPTIGFAWSPFKDNKTVIRGGAGMYWDTQSIYQEFKEGFSLGPPGDGRTNLSASIFTNTFPGIYDISTNSPVPIGASLPLQQLTNMTLAQYLQIYNSQLPTIQQVFPSKPAITSGPYPVSGIELSKSGIEMYLPNTPLTRSYQTSLGVQRELGHDMVLAVDWARRQFENVLLGEEDLNRFARYINGVQTPVIPQCSPAQALSFNPALECSTGSITFWDDEGRTLYDGLLVKLQKRMSKNYQFTASYAFQKELNMAAIDLDNLGAGYGQNLAHHNLNVAGVGNLPWGLTLSINSSIISPTPTTPIVAGVDLNGSGNTSFPITEAVPGLQYNCFEAGCSKAQLAAAVQTWNTTLAGTKDARGQTIPALVLPANYQFAAPIIDQDARLTKQFVYKERYKLQIFGEVFNAFNIANLSGYSTVLNTLSSNPAKQAYSFGQPTSRVLQTFGSGGPRAIQFGARVSF
jgi:hypothetical protein